MTEKYEKSPSDVGEECGYSARITKGFVFFFSGLIGSAIVAYLLRAFLARSLNLHDFGLFFAVYSFVIFFSFFRDLGIGNSLAKHIPEFIAKKQYEKIKSSIITGCIIQFIAAVIFITVFFVFSDFLAKNYFKDPTSGLILKILSLMYILLVFDDTLKKVFLGFQRIDYVTYIEIGKNIAFFAGTIILFYLGLGIYSPIYGYLVSTPIIMAIMFPVFLKLYPFFRYTISFNKEITKKIVMFGIPTMMIGIGDRIISYMDILILTFFVSLEEVGVYNVVVPTAILFLYISRSAAQVLYPLSSELAAKNEHKKLAFLLYETQKFSFVILVPFVLLLMCFPELYLSTMFGASFIAGKTALIIMLIGVLFFGIAKINFSVLAAYGYPGKVAQILITASAINIVANIILIPKYGISGAAIGTSISYLTALVISERYMRKKIESKLPIKDIILSLIAGIVMVIFTLFISNNSLINPLLDGIIYCFIGLILYSIMIFLMKIVCISEIKDMISFFVISKNKKKTS